MNQNLSRGKATVIGVWCLDAQLYEKLIRLPDLVPLICLKEASHFEPVYP